MPWSNALWSRLRSLTQPRHRGVIVVALLIGGIAVSCVSARTLEVLDTARHQEAVDGELRIVESRIERRIAQAVDALVSFRPLWQLRPDATDADFKAYLASGIAERRPTPESGCPPRSWRRSSTRSRRRTPRTHGPTGGPGSVWRSAGSWSR